MARRCAHYHSAKLAAKGGRRKAPLPIGLLVAGVLVLALSGMTGCGNGRSELATPVETYENRLAQETSPYLRQHADNPVDWYPWGKEALDRAKKEDKPIFLSIGYSACHWCHVMEAESFSNEKIAAIMNKYFVCIKVDREERPDLDEVYMNAVRMMTGQGGWPLTVFLTPDLKPFFGGTYFPPEERQGMIGFPRLLERVAEAYRTNRAMIESSSDAITRSLKQAVASNGGSDDDRAGLVRPSLLEAEAQRLLQRLDTEYGGFGRAPKFPQSAALHFLLEEYVRTNHKEALAAADLTLRQMAEGGLRDQLAGGFHRYSVDRYWRVPHFEKMLYDNALLAQVYLRAWELTRDESYADIVRSTLAFLVAEMQDSKSGFHATIDADTGHEEGAYYVWSLAEVEQSLGDDVGRRFAAVYGISRKGNFENGKNVLYLAETPAADLKGELKRARAKLLSVRSKRARPGVDRKVITAWNGIAISALAKAGAAMDEERYVRSARGAADFVLQHHRSNDDSTQQGDAPVLAHSSIDGRVGGPAFLDDYAYFISGLLELYQATLEDHYVIEADRLAREMLDRFSDPAGGALYYSPATGSDGHQLPIRPRKLLDASTPGPVAVAWDALLRLADLTGREAFTEAAAQQENALARIQASYPGGSYFALFTAARQTRAHLVVSVVGDSQSADTHALLRTVREYGRTRTCVVLLQVQPSVEGDRLRAISAVVRDMSLQDDRPAAYVCQGKTCFPPVTQASELRKLLEEKGRSLP